MKEKSNYTPKSFGVIGGGPVGSIMAAFLAKGGYQVTLCDVHPELTKPALERGIIIEGAENLQQKVSRVCRSVDQLAEDVPDVVIISVKANAIPLIGAALKTFITAQSYVISWQNGIDTEFELAKVLGKQQVLRAVVNFGGGLLGPAHVKMAFHHPPHYIQELVPETTAAAQGIAQALTRCGLPTERTDEIISMVWRKGILNACMNPICAVTGLTMAQAMNDPIVFELVDALIKECVQVARANEISLGWDFYPYAIEYMSTAGAHKPSMLIDIEKKRRTEVDFINGKFIEYGHQAGIKTPYNHMIRGLVKAIEPR